MTEVCRAQVEKFVPSGLRQGGGERGDSSGGDGVFGFLLGRAVNRAFQEISCTVQRQNARQVMGRVARIVDERSHVSRTAYANAAFFQEIFSCGRMISFEM